MFIRDKNNFAVLLLACKVSSKEGGFVYRFPLGVDELPKFVSKVAPLVPIEEQILLPFKNDPQFKKIVPWVNIHQGYRDEYFVTHEGEKITLYLADVDLTDKNIDIDFDSWALVPTLLEKAKNKSQRLCFFRMFQVLQGFLNSEVDALEVLEEQKLADTGTFDEPK